MAEYEAPIAFLTSDNFDDSFYKWVIHGSHEIPGEEDVAVEGEDAAGKSALHVARIKAFNQLPTYGSHYTDGLSSKAAQVEAYLVHGHKGSSGDHHSVETRQWLLNKDGSELKQHSKKHCCRALWYEFPYISVITIVGLVIGICLAASGLKTTTNSLQLLGIDDPGNITRLFITACCVMLIIDTLGMLSVVVYKGKVRSVCMGVYGCCCKQPHGKHHNTGLLIEAFVIVASFSCIVLMCFALVAVEVGSIVIFMYSGVCTEGAVGDLHLANMAEVMPILKFEFLGDAEPTYKREEFMMAVSGYCTSAREDCMMDCDKVEDKDEAGLNSCGLWGTELCVDPDGEAGPKTGLDTAKLAGWTSETCKCAYDPTDNHKVDAFRLLAGCVIMLFAQVNFLAIASMGFQVTKNELKEMSSLTAVRQSSKKISGIAGLGETVKRKVDRVLKKDARGTISLDDMKTNNP